jgi:hypothetical protein
MRWIPVLCLVLTLAVAIGAYFVLKNASDKARESAPARRLDKLELGMADLAVAFDDLKESHHRLRSKETMRERRASKPNGSLPSDPAALLRFYEEKHGLVPKGSNKGDF